MAVDCIDFDVFEKYYEKLDQKAYIDKNRDNKLRVNVWKTTSNDLFKMMRDKGIEQYPERNASKQIRKKLRHALRRVSESPEEANQFMNDIFDNQYNIELSIAMHEVMESIKGEADKARNNGVDISDVTNDGTLPVLPLARIAASIGRKIAFQKGFRFSGKETKKRRYSSPEEVESLYHTMGMLAIDQLGPEGLGYLDLQTNHSAIKDFIEERDTKKTMPDTSPTTDKYPTVSLNMAKLGIDPTSEEQINYFLDRSVADIADTQLGTIVEMLRAARLVTQPSPYVLPDTHGKMTMKDMFNLDDDTIQPDFLTNKARKALYDKPLYVNETIHDLMTLLNERTTATGKSADQIIRGVFADDPGLVASMFGLKNSDDFSIDKKESVTGQNLSKTTPLNDLVEYYDILQEGFDGPAPLHMALKIGRNARLYYVNSILNPHASKHSRYMLTGGPYDVKVDSEEYHFLVHQVGQVLGKDLSHDALTGRSASRLDQGLEFLARYDNANTIEGKLDAMAGMSELFPGVDYVSLLTAMKAVENIQNPNGGNVTTQFQVSADATASGGTLTFMQALGTNPEVTEFMEDIGFLTRPDGSVEIKLDDLYALMSESIVDFVDDKHLIENFVEGSRKTLKARKNIMQDMVDLMFNKRDNIRDLSKDPTMVFVYGQGKTAARTTIARSLADRIIDSLDSVESRAFLRKILPKDSKFNKVADSDLKIERGLYADIVEGLGKSGIPLDLYNLMDAAINKRYLEKSRLDENEENHKQLNNEVFDILDQIPKGSKAFKMLPAGAALQLEIDVEKAKRDPDPFDEMMGDSLFETALSSKGMPISKLFEVMHNFNGINVLTQKEKLMKTVMEVSTIHGIDAALLYHTIAALSLENGVVVVHDDIRGQVGTVMAAVKGYRDVAKNIAKNYDIHEQILKAVRAQHPNLVNADFKDLEKRVKAVVKRKKKIIDQQFNKNTDALIGDGDLHMKFAAKSDPNLPQRDRPSTLNVKSKRQTEKEADKRRVEKKRAEVKEALDENPSDIFVYDLETSGRDTEKDFIVQAAYKRGNGDVVSIPLKLEREQAETYLNNLRNVASVANSSIYKAIQASYEKDPSMKTWNKTAKSLDEMKKELTAQADEASIVTSFNGLTFDDQFMGGDIKTTHDLRRLSFDTTKEHFERGTLSQFVLIEDAHSADADVEGTFKLLTQFADNKVKIPKPANSFLEDFTNDSPLIEKFLDGSTRATISEENIFDPKEDEIQINLRGKDGKPLDPSSPQERIELVSMIEHEIVHSYTVGYIASQWKNITNTNSVVGRDLRYMQKAIREMKGIVEQESFTLGSAEAEAWNRMRYIVSQPNEQRQVAELVAIMTSEQEVASTIYNMLDTSANVTSHNLRQRIISFMKGVMKKLLDISEEDLDDALDYQKLQSAIGRTVISGQQYKIQSRDKAIQWQQTFDDAFQFGSVRPDLDIHTKRPDVGKYTARYVNYAVGSILNNSVEPSIKNMGVLAHKWMDSRYDWYTDTAGMLADQYDKSNAMQQIVHTITGNNVDKLKKADVLAEMARISRERNDTINERLGRFREVMTDIDEKEQKKIGNYVLNMPLHDYYILANEFGTAKKIEKEAARLEKELSKKNSKAVGNVKGIINRLTGKKEGKDVRVYNLAQKYPMGDSEFGQDLRKYMALQSIVEIGAKDFEKMILQRPELSELLKDQVIANRLSVMENSGSLKLNDTMMSDYYKEPVQIRAVDMKEFKKFEDADKTGWKIVKEPSRTEMGIVYRETIDSTDIAGAFTDTKLSQSDLTVDSDKSGFKGVVDTGEDFKLVLTKEQKREMGLIEDFAEVLVRSTAHNMSIQASQKIRDELIKKETLFTLTSKNADKLVKKIKANNIDNPWFIKMDGVTWNKLPAEVKARYQKVGPRVSDVKGFNDEVDLVRKDISHWLMGGSAKSLFQNPTYKWVFRILKDLVAGAKIGMVVLNPLKIAIDNVSNISYLGVMGVSPAFITKNYARINKEFSEYQELQAQVIQLKVQSAAQPDSKVLKKRIKTLQDRIKQNPVGDLAQKGFINSLGSDLVSRNADTLSGLQADMHKALEYMLMKKDGTKSHLGAFVSNMHKLGFNGEDFLQYIGSIAGKFDTTEGMNRELDLVAERLRNIRSNDDVVAYATQFINSPGSEAVRLGSAMTDLTDVLAKETLYRHLVENENRSPEQARLQVLDSFPDYKENMPLAIKQFSDVGVLMFPSFWLRIQKSIYRLMRDRPVNLSTELLLEEAVGANLETIFDQNVLNKHNTFGGLIHSPHEPLGWGSLFPTHLF